LIRFEFTSIILDIELAAVAQFQEILRPGAVVAFETGHMENTKVVLCMEVREEFKDTSRFETLMSEITDIVGRECGIALDVILLLKAHSIPRTTSGKVRRNETKLRFLDNTLPVVSQLYTMTDPYDTSKHAIAAEESIDSSNLRDAAPAAESHLENSEITLHRMKQVWSEVLDTPISSINEDTNFFEIGGDSNKAALIVGKVNKISSGSSVSIALGDFYANPTVSGLIYCLDPNIVFSKKSNQKLYYDDINEYDDETISSANLSPLEISPLFSENPVILLTGATGFVGSAIFQALKNRYPNGRILCLVRSDSPEEGIGRIINTVKKFHVWNKGWNDPEIILGDILKDRLGMSAADWEKCAQSVNAIIHCAANVIFFTISSSYQHIF
jgi:hypothetical protein